jgi:hypothetical protein
MCDSKDEMGDDRLGSAQVVDDDVDEPRAERALLVLFLVVLHGILLNRSLVVGGGD